MQHYNNQFPGQPARPAPGQPTRPSAPGQPARPVAAPGQPMHKPPRPTGQSVQSQYGMPQNSQWQEMPRQPEKHQAPVGHQIPGKHAIPSDQFGLSPAPGIPVGQPGIGNQRVKEEQQASPNPFGQQTPPPSIPTGQQTITQPDSQVNPFAQATKDLSTNLESPFPLENSSSNNLLNTLENEESLKAAISEKQPKANKTLRIEKKKGEAFKLEKVRHKLAGRDVTKKDLNKIKSGFDTPRYKVDLEFGLTYDIVEERSIDGLANDNNVQISRADLKIILANILTIYNVIGLTLTVVFIFIGVWSINLFALTLFANIILDVYQGIKGKASMEAVQLMYTQSVSTIREGSERKVKINKLVLDDLIVPKKGDCILVDFVIVDGTMEIYDKTIPGRGEIVEKKIGDIVSAGSIVISTDAKAQIDDVDGKLNLEKIMEQSGGNRQKSWSDMLFVSNVFLKIIAVLNLLFTIVWFFYNNF